MASCSWAITPLAKLARSAVFKGGSAGVSQAVPAVSRVVSVPELTFVFIRPSGAKSVFTLSPLRWLLDGGPVAHPRGLRHPDVAAPLPEAGRRVSPLRRRKGRRPGLRLGAPSICRLCGGLAGEGGQGLGDSDLRMMKKAIVSEAGVTDTTQGALMARSIFNQASQIDSGESSSIFGGAKTTTEIIENLFPKESMWGKQLYSGQSKAADNMINLGMDTKALYGQLSGKGLGDDYIEGLMGASCFCHGTPFGLGSKDSSISWGDMNFGRKE